MKNDDDTFTEEETFYQKTKKIIIKLNNYLKKEKNTKYLYIILLILIILILLNNNIISTFKLDRNKFNKIKIGGEGEIISAKAMKQQSKQLKAANKQSLKNYQQQQRANLYGKRDKQGNLLRDKSGNVRMQSRFKFIKKNLYSAIYILFAVIIFFLIPIYPLIIYIIFLHRVVIMMIELASKK